jgi:hypothetical protein
MLHDFAVPDSRHRPVELAGLRKYFSLFLITRNFNKTDQRTGDLLVI